MNANTIHLLIGYYLVFLNEHRVVYYCLKLATVNIFTATAIKPLGSDTCIKSLLYCCIMWLMFECDSSIRSIRDQLL